MVDHHNSHESCNLGMFPIVWTSPQATIPLEFEISEDFWDTHVDHLPVWTIYFYLWCPTFTHISQNPGKLGTLKYGSMDVYYLKYGNNRF